MDHFQRLNSAGHDFKGQLSSAYGQSGFGVSLGLDFDFGGVVAPFVHLEVGVSASAKRAAHSLVLIQRGPSKAWHQHFETPPPYALSDVQARPTRKANRIKLRKKYTQTKRAEDWRTNRPIGLALLRGTTWDLSFGASAAAWAGLGNAFDNDETGLAIGAKVEGEVLGRRTRLADMAARHYRNVYKSDLSNDVDDMLEDNLKRKAAAWLVMAADSRNAARKLDAPIEPVRHRMRSILDRLDKTTQEAFEAWDTHDTKALDRNLQGAVKTSFTGLRGLARKVRTAWRSHRLVTDTLIADITEAMGHFEAFHQAELNNLLNRQSVANALSQGNGGSVLNRDITITLKAATLRLSEGQQLIDALKRAKARKAERKNPPAQPVANPNETPDNPWFYLDIDSKEVKLSTQAGAKITLPRVHLPDRPSKSGKTARARATLTLQGGGFSRRSTFRFNSYAPAKAANDPILQTTQDTAVSYHFWSVSRERTTGRTEHKKEKELLATMSYRSAIAQWSRTGPMADKAIPNGSGACFGMSILHERLLAYADAVSKLPDDSTSPLTDPDDVKTEGLLAQQLRVQPGPLRLFARSIPKWLYENLEFGDAFVLESAHAFTKPLDLSFQRAQPVERKLRRPDLLMDHDAFIAVNERRLQHPDSALQAIRLRYRIRSDADRTKNLFALGLNPRRSYGQDPSDPTAPADYADELRVFDHHKVSAPGHDDFIVTADADEREKLKDLSGLQNQISILPERVTRVGTEGIFTVHEHLFPAPFDKDAFPGTAELADKITQRSYRQIAEYLVPPVQLFSQ